MTVEERRYLQKRYNGFIKLDGVIAYIGDVERDSAIIWSAHNIFGEVFSWEKVKEVCSTTKEFESIS